MVAQIRDEGRPQRERHQDEREHDPGVHAGTLTQGKRLLLARASMRHTGLVIFRFFRACFRCVWHVRRSN
jgi:hypothetical protein